jgi:hypothetical protein
MEQILGVDPYLTPFENLVDNILRLGTRQRHNLLSICELTFNDTNVRKDEHSRVAAAKLISGLVPDSAGVIRHWLTEKSGKYVYEIHFSLFCFLDQVPTVPYSKEFAREIPSLIENYLMEVKSDSGSAAFMAGDLLGDHWDTKEAIPILIRAAKGARFAAGRHNAVWALGHIYQRIEDQDQARKNIITLIKEISKRDRSNEVRITARLVIEDVI